MLICGPSASGKTVLLFNLLLQESWLDYTHLFIVSHSLFQKEYKLLRECLEMGLSKAEIRACFKENRVIFEGKKDPSINFTFYSDEKELPPPTELPIGPKYLIVFDDLILSKHNIVKQYFTQGRHSGADIIFLAQSYFFLDRQIVRSNSNFLICFKQPYKSLPHLFADFCSDLAYEEFRSLCNNIWKGDHNFLSIDVNAKLLDGHFRKNLDSFYIPRQFVCDENGLE